MEEKDAIVLGFREAMEAVCADFRQYDPQIMLFAEILPLVTEGRLRLQRERGKNGAWVRISGRRNMRWQDGRQLVATACTAVETGNFSAERLAALCSRVFRTNAVPVTDQRTGLPAVRIETGMEQFACLQCGLCCKSLDYGREVTSGDVERWKAANRRDILKWVGQTRSPEGGARYRIWIVPGTNRPAESCPFLRKVPSANRWICRIHDVKPEVCRQYPVSRKHAMMTGCRGFERNKTE